MRKSGLSSGFLKLGCYCSRILIHIYSLIQDFSSRLWSGLHNVVRYSSIRILPFCNTRLQQQTVAWITHGNLSDQFFCLDAMYEYFMVVKGYVHTVPDSETERHRN